MTLIIKYLSVDLSDIPNKKTNKEALELSLSIFYFKDSSPFFESVIVKFICFVFVF